MAEVIVIHEGQEMFRYSADAQGTAPRSLEMRAAITHALAVAIAALAELPPPADHPDRLYDIAERIKALGHPDGAEILNALAVSTRAHLDALERATAFAEAAGARPKLQ